MLQHYQPDVKEDKGQILHLLSILFLFVVVVSSCVCFLEKISKYKFQA